MSENKKEEVEGNLMKTEDAIKLINGEVQKYQNWLFIACDDQTGSMAINGDSKKVGGFLISTMNKNPEFGKALYSLLKPVVGEYERTRIKTDRDVN